MKKKLLICSILIFILSAIPSYAQMPNLPYKTYDLIPKNDFVLKKMVVCESGGNIYAIGRAGEIGILQFMPSTWALWISKMDKNLDINNPEHQIEVYHWAIKQGYSRHWTCWRKIFGI